MKGIKTKSSILVDTKLNKSEVLYFVKMSEQRADKAIFKGETGLYIYLIGIFVMRNGNLVPAHPENPSLGNIQAIYKLSDWISEFGDVTPNQMDNQIPSFMISEFGKYSYKYWGLESSDYEPFEID